MLIFNAVWNWIKTHPFFAFLGVVILVLLFLWATVGIGSTIESIRGRIFDNKQAAHEKEIAGLKAERDAAIKRGDEAETKALLKESEAKELRDLIAAKGGQIEAAAKEMERKLDEAKKGAGDCQALADDAARTVCLCKKLREMGFECG